MKRVRLLIAALAVVAVTAAALHPVLNNGFVNLDDNVLVYDNTKIMSLSPESVTRMFTTFHANLYHPLVLLSYAVEYHYFKAAPAVYHVTNFSLHLINCLLVFWLFYLLTAQALPAFLVALLFGIHPQHVESVAWISERKDVLYAFFFLLSLAGYVRYAKGGTPRFYFLSLAAFVLSLLSKPMAVTLPLVLVLFDFMLRLPLGDRRRLLEKIPFFAVAAVFVWVTMAGHYPDHQDKLLSSMTLFRNFLVACHDVLFYLGKAVLPVRLSALYPPAIPPGAMPSGFLLYGPAVLLFIVAAVIFSLRYTRKVLYGFLFFLVTVLPVVNLVPVGLGIAADRYTYIPYLGLFYIFAAGIARLFARIPAAARLQKGMLAASLGVLLAGFSLASWQRARVWHNDFSLYTDIIRNYKNVPIAYNNRGFANICRENYALALADCSAAARLDPEYFDALNNLANIYTAMGDYAAAEEYFNKAKNVRPWSDSVQVGLGNLYKRQGDCARALACYRRALEMNRWCDRAYCGIGAVYALKGDADQALREYSAALAVNPYNAQARAARGDLLMEHEEYGRAIADYSHLIEHRPTADAYYCRGLAHEKQAAYRKAVGDYTQAVRLNGRYAEAYCRRAGVFDLDGRYDQALDDYAQALAINPRYGEAYLGRAVTYFHKNNRVRSLEDVRKAQECGCSAAPGFLAQLLRHARERNSAVR